MTETLAKAKSQPQIDDPDELDRIVHRLIAEFQPVAIFLFGSRARREAWQDSDYDLMIVLRDDFPSERLKPTAWWSIVRSDRLEVNLSFSRQGAFGWRRHAVGTLEYEVEIDGIQLYPSDGEAFASKAPATLGPVKMNVVREWLEQVQHDLDAAFNCIHGPRAVPDRGAFHVQQAAEKLAKAALVAYRKRPERTHRIGDVVRQLPGSFALKQRFSALDRFTDFAVTFRYPDSRPLPLPSAPEVEAWIAQIEALKADFERWLDAREAKP